MSTILVVEDHAICREAIAAALRGRGFQVVCAEDRVTALQACLLRHPSLMLLDVVLPDGSGLDLLTEIRGHAELAKLPVILLTDVATRDAVLKATQLGVQGYLLKSRFTFDELLQKIQSILSIAALRSESTMPPPAGSVESEGSAAQKVNAPQRAAMDHTQGPPVRLDRDQTLRRLRESDRLRTLSGSVSEVIAVAGSPYAEREELAAVLKRDPILSARVLRMANSSAYAAGRSRAQTVEQAIGVIGFDGIRDMAASIGVFDAVGKAGADIRCWRHALAVADLMNEYFPKNDGTPRGVPHLVGLCHDFGELALRQVFPDEYAAVLKHAESTGLAIRDVEAAVFGVDRQLLAREVLGKLGLNAAIKDPICEFHRFEWAIGTRISPMATALRLLNLFADSLLLASGAEIMLRSVTTTELENAGLASLTSLSPDSFRGRIDTTTHLIAGPSPDEALMLRKPPVPRVSARLLCVCHPTLAATDPIVLALSLIADVECRTSPMDARDAENVDAVIFIAPTARPSATEYSWPSEFTLTAEPSVPAVIIGNPEGLGLTTPVLAIEKPPVSLNRVARFLSAEMVQALNFGGNSPLAAREGVAPASRDPLPTDQTARYPAARFAGSPANGRLSGPGRASSSSASGTSARMPGS